MNKCQNEIVQFKIFGERHTATNVIAELLIQNFNLDYPYYDFLGWKHRKAPTAKELEQKPLVPRTLFIITVRHPYEWVAAMHRWPYCDYDALINRCDLPSFLKYPIEDYANVLDLWNQKYASYQKLIELVPYAKIIRYEDFKKDQLAILRSLYKWLPKLDKPRAVTKYMHGWDTWTLTLTERSIGDFIFRHWLQIPPMSHALAPYKSNVSAPYKKPLAKITEEIAEMIDEQIDKSVLNYYYPEEKQN